MNPKTATSTPRRRPSGESLTLGRVVPEGGGPSGGGFPAVISHDPVLQPHLDRPWLRAWIAREFGLTPTPPPGTTASAATVTEAALARHALICGTSGSGKSRLAELLIGQQIARGRSLLAIEPKLETVRRLAAQAQAAGLPPERVTVVSPRAPGGAPGWNPFLAGLPPAESAADFVALIAGNAASWGPRLGDTLASAALVVAAHRLSVYELMRCLRDADYLAALLARPPAGPPTAAYREAADALAHEFLAGSKSARTEAAGAVTNKIRELLRNEYLRDLLTARANTLDLSALWERQGVVLVHLDRAGLGEEGARLLGGSIAGALFRTSLRASGPVPVVCSLDEVSTAERFVGETLQEIATFSRSANLSLVAACQNLSQMSGPLREALLSAGVQISFRLSPADARLVAASLAAGTPPSVLRVRAESLPPARKGGPVPRTVWRHPLRDASGRPLRLDAASWDRLRAEDLYGLPGAQGPGTGGEDPLRAAYRLAARHGVPRLYVRAADTGEPVEARRYVAGLSPASYWVDGPRPLSLAVSFPTPRLTGAQRRGEADAARAWTGALQSLPVQHAVLRVGGGEPSDFRVADVPDLSLAHVGPYLGAALRANGQTAQEVEACARERRETVARLASGEGGGARLGGRAHDGSTNNISTNNFENGPKHGRGARKGTGDGKTGDGRPDDGRTDGSGASPAFESNGFESNGFESNGFESGGFESGGFESGGFESGGFESGGFADDGSLG